MSSAQSPSLATGYVLTPPDLWCRSSSPLCGETVPDDELVKELISVRPASVPLAKTDYA